MGCLSAKPPLHRADARVLLRDYGGFGGLEAWIAEQPWTVVPGGWTAAGRVRGRSFRLELFGNDLRIAAVTPSGRGPGSGQFEPCRVDRMTDLGALQVDQSPALGGC